MSNENLDSYAKAYSGSFAYALDNGLILNAYPKRIARRFRGGTLLELGLGHGFSSMQFSSLVKHLVVVEGSSAVIEAFNAKSPPDNVRVVQDMFETYETYDRFDGIVMGFVLEHVDDPASIVGKFQKFLNPAGRMYIAVPNAHALNRRYGYAAGLISDMAWLSEADKMLGHKRYFSMNSLTELVLSVGMRPSYVEGLFLKPLTTAQLQTLALDARIFDAMMEVGYDQPELCVAILMECEMVL